MGFPADYAERVYAGVLGKVIGVYVGRPFEGWTKAQILERIGEVDYYMNDEVAAYNARVLGVGYRPPIVVTDDDITGTFTFLRALRDSGCRRDISAEEIGQAWLNYVVEGRSVFWWGGMGNSTEHTAYLRLKSGVPAPVSGSIGMNGKVVAEQIGSQIFIDGWAMAAPCDPAFAAELARRAASVSHDGEAVYGAQAIAAMESAAFAESGMDELLDIGTSVIPKDCAIRAVIDDVRSWHDRFPDWRDSFAEIEAKYGYDKFYGNVHIVPNHAVVIMSLLYGADDFRRAMTIVNSSGWDTDCNSANVGCLLGIRGGLACFDGELDWRGPAADRMLMPTADGGGAVTDAVRVALDVAGIGFALAGEKPDLPAGSGEPFSFCFPGSLQGFRPREGGTFLSNEPSVAAGGGRCLRISFSGEGGAATPVFILPEELGMQGYQFLASPRVYPGQGLVARVRAPSALAASIFITVYEGGGGTRKISGPEARLEAGAESVLCMAIPDTRGQPVAEIGVEARSRGAASLDLLGLSWHGSPNVKFGRPPAEPGVKDLGVWRRAWVNAVDSWDGSWREAYRLCQNSGRGLIMQGCRDWTDYEAEAEVSITMAKAAGIAVRVQGLKRYYALLLRDSDRVELVKFDREEKVLASAARETRFGPKIRLRLRAEGRLLQAWIDGSPLFKVEDAAEPLDGGAVAFVVEEGQLMSDELAVRR
jgi:ADP-ribosylglycohydrolase